MKIPIFGSLFDNISRFLNKPTHEILEFFSGPSSEEVTQAPTTENTSVDRPMTKCEEARLSDTLSPPSCTDEGAFRPLQFECLKYEFDYRKQSTLSLFF